MDILHESIALGVDLLILGLCVKEYVSHKKNVNSLKIAPQLAIDSELKNYVAQQKNQKVPYAVVRGTVTPIGVPMRSTLSPAVTGVVQVIKLREHRVARGFAGFWTEQRKIIHVSSNDMPFTLSHGGQSVEINNALTAAVLDMDIVYDNYEPSSLSFFDHIFGFFSGIRQKGLQTTEEVLRDGSFITGIGELELDGKTLRLQPSTVAPLFLTTGTKSTVIKRMEDVKSSMLVKIVACSTIAAVLISVIVRRIYLKKKRERDERKLKERLENERRRGRARVRPTNLHNDQLCVVCSTNPKEVIVLPCGHVCICEDCSQKIKTSCPMCRAKIDYKAAAFIS